jgi:hypothetical protein
VVDVGNDAEITDPGNGNVGHRAGIGRGGRRNAPVVA